MDKLKGIVKFFKKEDHWGFITSGEKDYFFHGNNVDEKQKVMYTGEEVVFELIETSKGMMAVNVTRERSVNRVGEKTKAPKSQTQEQEA